mmetsp:Transcript_3073/g.9375  ORF Transcript_3073/g.9375 Transcript_3073/m.9375 type:complete len:171 (+) Transcript_3073:68-580(+)
MLSNMSGAEYAVRGPLGFVSKSLFRATPSRSASRKRHICPRMLTYKIPADFRLPAGMLLITGVLSPTVLNLEALEIPFSILTLAVMFQAVAIRFEFDEDAMEVLRFGYIMQRHAFSTFVRWRMWPSEQLPLVFFFSERQYPNGPVKSHLVPVVFNAREVSERLHQHIQHY